MTPLVSVIMPMRNAEPFVQAALASVLCERQVPLEVVVVDDGSSDQSRTKVAELGDPRIRVIPGAVRGIAAALNAGFAQARGGILMRCDADDLYAPSRIAQQTAWLRTNPQHDAVCGAFGTIDSRGRLVANLVQRGEQSGEDVDAELRRGVTRTHLCTFAIRKPALQRAGLFRDYFETAEDLDFQLRLGELCRVRYLPHDTYFYRLHAGSVTHTQRERRRVFFEYSAREFQAQRATTGADALMLGRPPEPPSALDSLASPVSLQIQGMLVGQAWRDLHQGHGVLAVKGAWRALLTQPRNASAWANLAKILARVARPK